MVATFFFQSEYSKLRRGDMSRKDETNAENSILVDKVVITALHSMI